MKPTILIASILIISCSTNKDQSRLIKINKKIEERLKTVTKPKHIKKLKIIQDHINHKINNLK